MDKPKIKKNREGESPQSEVTAGDKTLKSVTDELRKYGKLLKKGKITSEEFEKKKGEILGV